MLEVVERSSCPAPPYSNNIVRDRYMYYILIVANSYAKIIFMLL